MNISQIRTAFSNSAVVQVVKSRLSQAINLLGSSILAKTAMGLVITAVVAVAGYAGYYGAKKLAQLVGGLFKKNTGNPAGDGGNGPQGVA